MCLNVLCDKLCYGYQACHAVILGNGVAKCVDKVYFGDKVCYGD